MCLCPFSCPEREFQLLLIPFCSRASSTERNRFLFAGGPLQQHAHTHPPRQAASAYVCLKACCGLQICMALHMCTFTERLWHIQSLTSTHVQIHTHPPQGPWCIHIRTCMWSSSSVPKKLHCVCLLRQPHARGASGYVYVGMSGMPQHTRAS